MILKLLLNTQMIWMISIKILNNAMQIRNEKYKLLLMIWLLLCLVIKNLFIRGRKLKVSLVFITQSYFAVSKNVWLNSTHYFIIKIPNRSKLQKIAFNHLSDIDFQDFINPYKNFTAKPHSLFSYWCYSCIR